MGIITRGNFFIMIILPSITRNVDKLNYFTYLPTKNKPADTNGPIANANTIVPIPTIPPRYQPTITALISRIARIREIGKFVFFL